MSANNSRPLTDVKKKYTTDFRSNADDFSLSHVERNRLSVSFINMRIKVQQLPRPRALVASNCFLRQYHCYDYGYDLIEFQI